MTLQQREQKARGVVRNIYNRGVRFNSCEKDDPIIIQEVLKFVDEIERATLEEVAKEIASTRDKVSGSTFPLSSVLADIIRWLNGLIKERS